MSTDPRAALERLTLALDNHLVALERRRGDDDPAVDRAYETLEDACEAYDEAIFTVFNETLPFGAVGEDEDDDDEDEEDFDDEGDTVAVPPFDDDIEFEA